MQLEGLVMQVGFLQQFHGAMIEVELDVRGMMRSICGKGSYDDNDPDLGPVLKILVTDPSGNFELMIAESNWSGRIEASRKSGCDYRISLPSCATC